MTGRPARPQEAARVERLAVILGERDVDLMLVGSPVNLRYLTAFTGSNGLAVIGACRGQGPTSPHRMLTDFRYIEQSAAQVPAIFERVIVTQNLLESLAETLGAGAGAGEPSPAAQQAGGRIGFEDDHMTVKDHARLREILPEAWDLVPCGGLVEDLREIKDSIEVARVRAASELADEALRSILETGLVGKTEREVAIELELRMRRLGAEGPSFPTIVAAGEHSALPHAEPREVLIPADVLVTIDWGAQLDGYCSDGTRVFATGQVTDQQRSVHELVLKAHLAGIEALRAGLSGREVDAVARAVIEQAGYGESFGHGLGHGVGLEIHEAPRLSRLASDAPLRAGQVVTVEPGIYIPGAFGARIEDLLVVTETGSESLSGLDKGLVVVG